MSNKVDNYINEARKAGFTVKRFVYDIEKYKQDQENKIKLEHRIETLKVIHIDNNLYRLK
jgi:hypothetical protein